MGIDVYLDGLDGLHRSTGPAGVDPKKVPTISTHRNPHDLLSEILDSQLAIVTCTRCLQTTREGSNSVRVVHSGIKYIYKKYSL